MFSTFILYVVFLFCLFVSQLAVEADALFDGVISDLDVTIDYFPDGEDPIQSIFDYVEAMRCSLWDTAFFREFGAAQQVHKNNTIDKQPNFHPALRRVLYRYFKYILLPRKAISKVPPFFPNYLEPSSSECMYTIAIMKAWDSCHYESCGWYLDCPVPKPPLFDIALRDRLQPKLSEIVSITLSERAGDAITHPKTGGPKSRATSRVVRSKGGKRKAADYLDEDVDEDIVAMTAVEPPQSHPLGPQKSTEDSDQPAAKKSKINPDVESSQFSMTPPKLKTMRTTQASSSSNTFSEVLILNDSFVRMLEFKANNGNKFPPSYATLVDFLTKVLKSSPFSC